MGKEERFTGKSKYTEEVSLINHRRACAARVTVLGLCVYLSVTTFMPPCETNQPIMGPVQH
jgi:hypothetical protein